MTKYKNSGLVVLFVIFLTAGAIDSNAQDAYEDGTYDATVTTQSGSYTVPVEVENGEVSHVYWPNGGAMTVYGGELDGSDANGINSRGDFVTIKIEE